MTFEVLRKPGCVQFGIFGAGKTPIGLDYIDLIAEAPPSPSAMLTPTDAFTNRQTNGEDRAFRHGTKKGA